MQRKAVLEALSLYSEKWVAGQPVYKNYDFVEEQAHCVGIRSFVADTPTCFQRSCLEGHITGSALVTSHSFDRVLLTLHAKLNKWLQLGGHCDGESDVAGAALREAQEESGRSEVQLVPLAPLWAGKPTKAEVPFDLDIHVIPARKDEPEHAHYDIRYLCVLDPQLPLIRSHESKELTWLSLAEARRLTSERSMHRQFDKLEAIAQKLQK